MSQTNLIKTTSLQAWDRLINKYFHKHLRIENQKDREAIYQQLQSLGLPHEQFVAFPTASRITQLSFKKAVKNMGFPYWISLVPLPQYADLDRLSKLCIHDFDTGWQFIQSLDSLEKYKLLIMQYADNPLFKGTAIVSGNHHGIADFVLGDHHYQLSIGATLTDPLIFNSKSIHYSKTITRQYQNQLVKYILNQPGYYEFQYGTIKGQTGLTFLDNHDEPAYEDIEIEFNNLKNYVKSRPNSTNKILLKGLPASPGQAQGKCKVILSKNPETLYQLQKGDILVSDITTPDMTPIMAKPGAIITDLGGVTSHAAIVCRELGIPCITGTQNGTKILKKGMEVLVDSSKGVVLKVE